MDHDRSSLAITAFCRDYIADKIEWRTTEMAADAVAHFAQEPGRLEAMGRDLAYQICYRFAQQVSTAGRRGSRPPIRTADGGIVDLTRIRARSSVKWSQWTVHGTFGYKRIFEANRQELLEAAAIQQDSNVLPNAQRVQFLLMLAEPMSSDPAVRVTDAWQPEQIERLYQQVINGEIIVNFVPAANGTNGSNGSNGANGTHGVEANGHPDDTNGRDQAVNE